MSVIPVEVYFDRLFCWQGPDENGASEPYLWVVMVKLDGSSIQSSGNSLVGAPATFFSAGSHGNIGSGILPGVALHIPAEVGLWRTTLQPIVISDPLNSGDDVEVPGIIIAVAILLEENSTPDDAIEAGHQALNTFIVSQFSAIVSSIDLMAVAKQVATEVAAGKDRTTATQDVINGLFAPAIATLKSMAEPTVLNAILAHLGINGIIETITSFGDVDAFQGVVSHTFTQTDLANTATNGAAYGLPQIPIEDMIADTDKNDRWQFDYTLQGFAWQTIEITVTPIPEGVAPGRWRVANVNKAHSKSSGRDYITDIAGQLADNSLWWLGQADAIAKLQAGTNTFYVQGADGSNAEVVVGSALPIHRNYLTTHPDGSTEDNLSGLPSFFPYLESQHNDP